jgi:hypothetical protein
MKLNVTSRETMLNLQGDLVLLNPGHEDEMLLTIVRVVDVDRQWLALSNRQSKARESYELTQEAADRLSPSKDPRAKWQMFV